MLPAPSQAATKRALTLRAGVATRPPALDPLDRDDGLSIESEDAVLDRTTPQARVELAAADDRAERAAVRSHGAAGEDAQPAHGRVRDIERSADRREGAEAPRADRPGARLVARVPRLLEQDDSSRRDALASNEVQGGARARGPPSDDDDVRVEAHRLEPERLQLDA